MSVHLHTLLFFFFDGVLDSLRRWTFLGIVAIVALAWAKPVCDREVTL